MAEAPPEKREERWIYLGKRMSRSDTILHLWLDADGQERVFTKLKGTTPGNIYLVTVARRDADGAEVMRDVRYTGEQHPDAAARMMWDADHRATEVQYEANRKNRATQGELASHVNALRAAYRGQKTHARKAAILAQFIEEITR